MVNRNFKQNSNRNVQLKLLIEMLKWTLIEIFNKTPMEMLKQTLKKCLLEI